MRPSHSHCAISAWKAGPWSANSRLGVQLRLLSGNAAEAFARDLFQAGGIEHRDVSVTVPDQACLLQRSGGCGHPGSRTKYHRAGRPRVRIGIVPRTKPWRAFSARTGRRGGTEYPERQLCAAKDGLSRPCQFGGADDEFHLTLGTSRKRRRPASSTHLFTGWAPYRIVCHQIRASLYGRA
jgi:hypothetical protein